MFLSKKRICQQIEFYRRYLHIQLTPRGTTWPPATPPSTLTQTLVLFENHTRSHETSASFLFTESIPTAPCPSFRGVCIFSIWNSVATYTNQVLNAVVNRNSLLQKGVPRQTDNYPDQYRKYTPLLVSTFRLDSVRCTLVYNPHQPPRHLRPRTRNSRRRTRNSPSDISYSPRLVTLPSLSPRQSRPYPVEN